MKRIDFHTHTILSDGELLPVELARRAEELNHMAIGITDHVGFSNFEQVVKQTVEASERINESMEIKVIPGVELTHIPLSLIPELAEEARQSGAKLVVMHGETIVEPVPPGTNIAALKCKGVDILGHPGLLSREEAELAGETGTYIELSSRDGHSLTNGRIARLAEETGARMLINTDTHSPEDLITYAEAEAIGLGAGLDDDGVQSVLEDNPSALMEKCL